jgi:hypothetical protein
MTLHNTEGRMNSNCGAGLMDHACDAIKEGLMSEDDLVARVNRSFTLLMDAGCVPPPPSPTHTDSLSLTHTHSLAHSPTHTHICTHTLSLSLTHAHTHTHSLALVPIFHQLDTNRAQAVRPCRTATIHSDPLRHHQLRVSPSFELAGGPTVAGPP